MTPSPALWQAGGGAVTDFDAAYANGAAITNSHVYPERWAAEAQAFRAAASAAGRARIDIAYGAGPRNRYDLFLPASEPAGLVVFVHGGYWKAFDKASWSHLAAGALARGHAVALPSYTLCPQTRLAGITREIGAFLDHVARDVPGPIALVGHSAGGHLIVRMLSEEAPIRPETAGRIAAAVSISGVHDLRPLLKTTMKADLRLDPAEAAAESPALLSPRPGCRLLSVCGSRELPEFRRQTLLIANVWHGLGCVTEAVEIADRHHFDVIEGLCDPDSPIVRSLVG